MGRNLFVDQLFNGLTIGSIYGLVGLGFSLIYSILGLINFAHGDMYMFGAFIGYTAMSLLDVNFYVAIIIVLLLCGLLGILVERVAYKPIRKYPAITQMVSSLAVGIVLRNLAMIIWGSQTYPFKSNIDANIRVLIPVIVFILMISMHIFLTRTRYGIAIRATSMDLDMASSLGINSEKTISIIYSVGSCLGGFAGILVAAYYESLSFDIGAMMGIKSFIATIIGGLGSMYGPFVGGFILGISESLAQAYISSAYKDALAFIILIIILFVRPAGLLGKKIEKGG